MKENRREITEEAAIGELLKSKDFNEYYNSVEINEIKPIHWILDEQLPVGFWGSAGWAKQGNTSVPLITLQKIPVSVEHIGRIAHEIQHLLLDKEGFPRVICIRPNRADLSSSLKSMVQDPLINIRLKPYEFDVKKDHMEMLDDYKHNLIKFVPESPKDRFQKMGLAINFVRNILRWETAFADGHHEDNSFQMWFDKSYPEITREGKALQEIINKIGYDTPDKQLKLFKKISKKYNIKLNYEPKP